MCEEHVAELERLAENRLTVNNELGAATATIQGEREVAEERERVLREALGDAGRQVRGICDDWVAEMGVGPTSDWLVQRFLPLADRIAAALAVSPEQPGASDEFL